MTMSEIKQENYQKQGAPFEARPHVLVVDDDRRIRDLLSRYLDEYGFVVLSAEDAGQAKELLKSFEVDVLVVDVMMPGQSGVDFTQELRAQCLTPVVLLTALGDVDDRVKGLEAGADDYLPKPFEPRELVLRLNAILKRTAKTISVDRAFRVGPWVFDPESNVLEGEGRTIKLTSTEVLLMKAFGQSDGEVLSREALAKACDIDSGERTVDVQITRLRRKIEEDTKNPRFLKTVRGKGYILRVEIL